ncbi:hypothetical protein Taro_016013 [Colocasia esculenta]|uniref:BHLH domain-containing protein n=1 Tax=Colocasia esculenta TaxID=4460 RepID=A0A843UP29_COLES|nr:hypothetical protein [Colocasia esculenta]
MRDALRSDARANAGGGARPTTPRIGRPGAVGCAHHLRRPSLSGRPVRALSTLSPSNSESCVVSPDGHRGKGRRKTTGGFPGRWRNRVFPRVCPLSSAVHKSTPSSSPSLRSTPPRNPLASLATWDSSTVTWRRRQQLAVLCEMDGMEAGEYERYWETQMFFDAEELDSWSFDDAFSGYYDSSSPDGAGSSSAATAKKSISQERERRKRFNEKLYTLRSLVPSITKVFDQTPHA